jgi:hypothetical protein
MAEPQPFEKASRLFGELLILLLYAEAYHEAVENFIGEFRRPGSHSEPALIFAIFFFVSVRFFVGNHLLLSDSLWREPCGEPIWQDEKKGKSTRISYYIAVFFVVLESLAMIGLGAFGSVEAGASMLLTLLIAISSIDVVWIVVQLLRDWIVKARCRPDVKLQKWMYLNLGAIFIFLLLLHCYRGQSLDMKILAVITAVNFIAFATDLVLFNVAKA